MKTFLLTLSLALLVCTGADAQVFVHAPGVRVAAGQPAPLALRTTTNLRRSLHARMVSSIGLPLRSNSTTASDTMVQSGDFFNVSIFQRPSLVFSIHGLPYSPFNLTSPSGLKAM